MHQKRKISCSYKSKYLVSEKLAEFKLICCLLGSYDTFLSKSQVHSRNHSVYSVSRVEVDYVSECSKGRIEKISLMLEAMG